MINEDRKIQDEKDVLSAPSAEAAAPEGAIPAPPVEPDSAGRKKTSEHRNHKNNKDHRKIKSLKAEIEALKKDLEQRTREAAAAREEVETARKESLEWKDRTLRAMADTDNFRKRLEREKDEFFLFSLSDILKEFLQVIDNLERALDARDASDGFREGVELICRQMLDLVGKRGVTLIERPDGRFDPNVHQALLTEEAEGIEEPMIGEELQKGYMLNDRLLRPALVKVLMPKKN